MAIRKAEIDDIPNIIDFLLSHKGQSVYADATWDRPTVVRSLGNLIIRKEGFLWISGEVDGVLAGFAEPYWFSSRNSYATDLVFLADKGGRDLLKQFRKWAFEHRKVDEITHGVSSGIGSHVRVGKMFERLGYECVGGNYMMRNPNK